jgi:hypothetical protein
MEDYYVQHSPDHTWHYLDNQMEDEVVLFKTYDSDEMTANCAYLQGCDDIVLTTFGVCVHTSLERDETVSQSASRESVELRTIVIY